MVLALAQDIRVALGEHLLLHLIPLDRVHEAVGEELFEGVSVLLRPDADSLEPGDLRRLVAFGLPDRLAPPSDLSVDRLLQARQREALS